METWKDFLVEHAKFPFPTPTENHASTTLTSDIEVGQLDKRWKAECAICDGALIQNLCNTLDNFLGDAVIPESARSSLLLNFSPALRYAPWHSNVNEAVVRLLLSRGVFEASSRFLDEYDQCPIDFLSEVRAPGAASKVDFVLNIGSDEKLLIEAKSTSVMATLGELPRGIKLTWDNAPGLAEMIFTKAALYLAQRKMEWLFLTSHNHWIVCRLISHDTHPFLAYSPKISILNSSEPFRVFLGAILSTMKGVPVSPSIFTPGLQLDTVEEDPGSESEDDDHDDSGTYNDGENDHSLVRSYNTRSHTRNGCNLMVTSSSPTSPNPLRTWIHLHALSNSTLALPLRKGGCEHRMWLTYLIGSGSTGDVWECHFNGDSEPYALKVVEMLRPSDSSRRNRLHNEFDVYQTLEMAYASRQLDYPIAPRCYGAFKGDHMEVLLLEFCGTMLNSWDELSASECAEVCKLVENLHSVGIVHGDLEPRNVLRVRGGGLRLADFSNSSKHRCEKGKNCLELKVLRRLLKSRYCRKSVV